MKRQAIDHTKMDLLMRKLNLPRWGAVGILESLWHLTAKEAPRGDIGRLSNERIAIGIEWRGAMNSKPELEADKLMRALVEAGWMEVNSIHRFVIHDWQEHADNSVKKYLKRNNLTFACLDMSGHGGKLPDMASLPLPVPVPLPAPASSPTNGVPPMPPISQSEYPLTIAEIRKHDPAADEMFVLRLVQEVSQACISSKEFPQEKLNLVTDKYIARCCAESYRAGPAKHGSGLLLKRVPPIAISWSVG